MTQTPDGTTKNDYDKMTLEELLRFMRFAGSSVVLTWGEDNELWECSWITSGERVTTFGELPWIAARKTVGTALMNP